MFWILVLCVIPYSRFISANNIQSCPLCDPNDYHPVFVAGKAFYSLCNMVRQNCLGNFAITKHEYRLVTVDDSWWNCLVRLINLCLNKLSYLSRQFWDKIVHNSGR